MGAHETPESLQERVERVIGELAGIERRPVPAGSELLVGGRPFAVLGDGRIEVLLAPVVAAAVVRTPDASVSPRGAGWVAFAPTKVDRFALDRAESWLQSAYRRALGD
jgi:hypothetical protein